MENSITIILLVSLCVWSSMIVLTSAIYRALSSTDIVRSFNNHYILYTLPLFLLFVATFGRLLFPVGWQHWLSGSCVALNVLITTGRYQYIRYLLSDNMAKAYTNRWELLAVVFSLGAYIAVQNIHGPLETSRVGLSRIIEEAFTFKNHNSTLISIFYFAGLYEVSTFVFQYRLLKKNKKKFSKPALSLGKNLMGVHYLTIVIFISGIILVASLVIENQALYTASWVSYFSTQLLLLGFIQVTSGKISRGNIGLKAKQSKEFNHLFARLMDTLISEEMFKKKGLRIYNVAVYLNISEKDLRDSIAQCSSVGFPTLVNLIRLNHLSKLCNKQEHDSISVLDLSKLSGFSSKSSLHRVCVEWALMSPTELRNDKRIYEYEHIMKG